MKDINTIIQEKKPKPKLSNLIFAFIGGATVSVLGQFIMDMIVRYTDLSKSEAVTPMIIIIIALTCLLTGLGVYDKLATIFGAGLFIPITGFANSMCSSALESKHEGLVYGIGSNIFKLAGSVLVYGVVATYLVGVVRFIYENL
ncbi:MAG: SpoVA/SpoVAEb family sporulation membrane protein [Erysipelotrichales bacterium]|nr:SpoVA/SpoVAEb family sporulation membrane protein [Erysipelotrichales bacterium]